MKEPQTDNIYTGDVLKATGTPSRPAVEAVMTDAIPDASFTTCELQPLLQNYISDRKFADLSSATGDRSEWDHIRLLGHGYS